MILEDPNKGMGGIRFDGYYICDYPIDKVLFISDTLVCKKNGTCAKKMTPVAKKMTPVAKKMSPVAKKCHPLKKSNSNNIKLYGFYLNMIHFILNFIINI